KGASPADVEINEERMVLTARRILAQTGIDVSDLPGAGAAGGVGGALAACCGGKLVRGIDTILKLIGFDTLSDGADWILTGEGKSDRQTLAGKAPYGVLQRAGTIPVALLSGRIEHPETLRSAGFSYLDAITPTDLPDAEAIHPDIARTYLTLAARRFANTIAT
ncbi:MAG: glycerate kinase, partial [Bacteroidales bacterium]|nr:glycerate kinase [Bacteroidales bacterium]